MLERGGVSVAGAGDRKAISKVPVTLTNLSDHKIWGWTQHRKDNLFHFTTTRGAGWARHGAEAAGTEMRQHVVSFFEGLTASSGDEWEERRVPSAAGPRGVGVGKAL